MRRSFVRFVLGAVALAAPLFMAEKAEAGVCGWLADGKVECELDVTGGCEARCEPLSFTAQCGYECSGGCNANVDVGCSVDCQGGCEAECEANPGNFSCSGQCEVNCSGECDAHCEAAGNRAECIAQCKGSCQGDCSANCQGTPPSVSCKARCEASCKGECHARANIDCNIKCQGGCSADLQGGCEADCRAPEGALFCDGQYVTVDNVNDCELYVDFSADAHCDGSGCEAVAACTACSTSGSATSPFDATAVAAMALGVGLIVSRRRNKKSA